MFCVSSFRFMLKNIDNNNKHVVFDDDDDDTYNGCKQLSRPKTASLFYTPTTLNCMDDSIPFLRFTTIHWKSFPILLLIKHLPFIGFGILHCSFLNYCCSILTTTTIVIAITIITTTFSLYCILMCFHLYILSCDLSLFYIFLFSSKWLNQYEQNLFILCLVMTRYERQWLYT